MRLLLILFTIPNTLCYVYFTPIPYGNKEEATWKHRHPNHDHQRYPIVFPQLGNTNKWKDRMDLSSVNNDNNGYVNIFNNLQHVNKLKQSNKGLSYIMKEDKVKALEDQIQIVAAPKLNSNMIQSDRRIPMKIEPVELGV